MTYFTHNNIYDILPAQTLSVKVFAVSGINDDDVVMSIQVTLHSVLRRPGQVTLVSTFLSCPPESIRLWVLFGKHQQYLYMHIYKSDN